MSRRSMFAVLRWAPALVLLMLVLDGRLLLAAPSGSTIRRAAAKGIYLPIVRQATSYSCGAASLLSVLQRHHRYDGSESSLYRKLGTNPRSGTHPEKIVEVARRFGLKAELKEGLTLADLRAAVRAEKAVILDLQAWRLPKSKHTPWKRLWEDGHYVVLKSVGTKYVYFMDPSAGPDYAYMPLRELVDRWHDYEIGRGADGKRHRRNFVNAGIVIEGGKKVAGPGLIRMQ